MLDKRIYEYAVIRIVPRVEREEFINAGIILFSKKSGFLDCKIDAKKEKVLALFPEVDFDFILQNLNAFECVAKGEQCDSPISKLDASERFRWLTATRSTIIQSSKVHIGITEDENETLKKLFGKLVKG